MVALGAGARCHRGVRLVPAPLDAGAIGTRGLLRIVGGAMVGPKERVVLVEVGDTWLLLGVAASSVNLLHTLPKPPQSAAKER